MTNAIDYCASNAEYQEVIGPKWTLWGGRIRSGDEKYTTVELHFIPILQYITICISYKGACYRRSGGGCCGGGGCGGCPRPGCGGGLRARDPRVDHTPGRHQLVEGSPAVHTLHINILLHVSGSHRTIPGTRILNAYFRIGVLSIICLAGPRRWKVSKLKSLGTQNLNNVELEFLIHSMFACTSIFSEFALEDVFFKTGAWLSSRYRQSNKVLSSLRILPLHRR